MVVEHRIGANGVVGLRDKKKKNTGKSKGKSGDDPRRLTKYHAKITRGISSQEW